MSENPTPREARFTKRQCFPMSEPEATQTRVPEQATYRPRQCSQCNRPTLGHEGPYGLGCLYHGSPITSEEFEQMAEELNKAQAAKQLAISRIHQIDPLTTSSPNVTANLEEHTEPPGEPSQFEISRVDTELDEDDRDDLSDYDSDPGLQVHQEVTELHTILGLPPTSVIKARTDRRHSEPPTAPPKIAEPPSIISQIEEQYNIVKGSTPTFILPLIEEGIRNLNTEDETLQYLLQHNNRERTFKQRQKKEEDDNAESLAKQIAEANAKLEAYQINQNDLDSRLAKRREEVEILETKNQRSREEEEKLTRDTELLLKNLSPLYERVADSPEHVEEFISAAVIDCEVTIDSAFNLMREQLVLTEVDYSDELKVKAMVKQFEQRFVLSEVGPSDSIEYLEEEAERAKKSLTKIYALLADSQEQIRSAVGEQVKVTAAHIRQYHAKVCNHLPQNIQYYPTTARQNPAPIGEPTEKEIELLTEHENLIKTLTDEINAQTKANRPGDGKKNELKYIRFTLKNLIEQKLATVKEQHKIFTAARNFKTFAVHAASRLQIVTTNIRTADQALKAWHELLTAEVARTQADVVSANVTLPKASDIKFQGFEGTEDVYAFVERIRSQVGAHCTDSVAAAILYSNLLTEKIKTLVVNVQDDWEGMIKLLLKEFGQPIRIITTRVEKLAELKIGNNPETAAKYWAELVRALEDLQEMVVKNGTLATELYHNGVITTIIQNTPEREEIIKLIQKKTSETGEELTPKEEFESVIEHAKVIIGRLKIEERLTAENIIGLPGQQRTVQSLQQQQPLAEQLRDQNFDQQNRGNTKTMWAAAAKTGRKVKQKRILAKKAENPAAIAFREAERKGIQFPCFICEDPSHSYSDCDAFMNAQAALRNVRATDAAICKNCLKSTCVDEFISKDDDSTNKCIQRHLSQATCEPCARGETQFGMPAQISCWLCRAHAHQTAQQADILMQNMKKNFPQMKARAPPVFLMMRTEDRNPPSPEVKTFNLSTGKETSRRTLLRSGKIKNPEQTPGVYISQVLNFAGRPTLVVYDSGANTSAASHKFIKDLNLAQTDNTQVTIALAGVQSINSMGNFSLCMGPDQNNTYHDLELRAVRQITTRFPSHDLQPSIDLLKDKYPHLRQATFPKITGGLEVDLVIGMSAGHLQPKHLYNLDTGLILAESKFMDMTGSALCIGGNLTQEHTMECSEPIESTLTQCASHTPAPSRGMSPAIAVTAILDEIIEDITRQTSNSDPDSPRPRASSTSSNHSTPGSTGSYTVFTRKTPGRFSETTPHRGRDSREPEVPQHPAHRTPARSTCGFTAYPRTPSRTPSYQCIRNQPREGPMNYRRGTEKDHVYNTQRRVPSSFFQSTTPKRAPAPMKRTNLATKLSTAEKNFREQVSAALEESVGRKDTRRFTQQHGQREETRPTIANILKMDLKETWV